MIFEGPWHFDTPVATMADEEDLQNVGNLTLGPGYIDAAALVQNEVIETYLLKKDGAIAGYGTCWVEPRRSLSRLLKGHDVATLPAYVHAADESSKLGIIGSVGVLDRYRHHGGGSQIVQMCVSKLIDQGAQAILVTAWESVPDGQAMIEGVLQRLGFERTGYVPEFWHAESKLEKYQCPADGYPCHCAAVLFAKQVG